MIHVSRRGVLAASGALTVGSLLPLRSVARATDYMRMKTPPPISRAERIARLDRARQLMRAAGIGAILVESGPSLDYYTGVQWRRAIRSLSRLSSRRRPYPKC